MVDISIFMKIQIAYYISDMTFTNIYLLLNLGKDLHCRLVVSILDFWLRTFNNDSTSETATNILFHFYTFRANSETQTAECTLPII